MEAVNSLRRFRPLWFVRVAATAAAFALVLLSDSTARAAAGDAGGAVLASGAGAIDWLGGAGFGCLIVILAALATDGPPTHEKSRSRRAGASVLRRRE